MLWLSICPQEDAETDDQHQGHQQDGLDPTLVVEHAFQALPPGSGTQIGDNNGCQHEEGGGEQQQ